MERVHGRIGARGAEIGGQHPEGHEMAAVRLEADRRRTPKRRSLVVGSVEPDADGDAELGRAAAGAIIRHGVERARSKRNGRVRRRDTSLIEINHFGKTRVADSNAGR